MPVKPDIEHLVEQTTEAGQLRRELRTERDKVKLLSEQLSETRQSLAVLESIDQAKPTPPKWAVARHKVSTGATFGLFITDTHFDEVVRPEEIGGLNAYNRSIAEQRLERAFVQAVRVARDYVSGLTYDGVLLLLGGDIVGGEIHHEYEVTNEATIVETLLHWTEPLAAGIELLAGEFGKVHVAGVVGNHGRRTRKPRYKGRARDNYDWLLYRSVAKLFRGDDRITWQLPESLYADVQIYDTAIRLEHGDEAKGGSGIAAAMSPMLLLQHRRTKQYRSSNRPLDLLAVGHWHSRYVLPGLIMGGTLKGVDEHTLGRGYDYQPPSQEAFVIAPNHGVILNAPVWVQDRHAEGW